MDFLVAFVIFLVCMITSVIKGFSMAIPLLIGFFAFAAVALRRGCSVRDIAGLTCKGIKKGLVVVLVMVCIGVLTAMWRYGGTILFFVYYGVSIITPKVFILAAFVLSAVLSYALGTSFGVSGTMGVILMSIAVAGGADTVITGGAIISGVYFGDRCSYASSSAILTAMLTETDMQKNVPMMMKTGLIPIGTAAVLYAILSFTHPMNATDPVILSVIRENYSVAWPTVIPALIMFILPLFKVDVKITMLISAACAFGTAVALQGVSVQDALVACVMGVPGDGTELGDMLAGGGIKSMFEICLILMISCSYSEIFEAADMLAPVTKKMSGMMNRIGRFASVTIVGILSCAVFCNQTIGDIVTVNVVKDAYKEVGGTPEEFAMDIENSLIVLAGIVPWCLACKVPLTLIGADFSSAPYAFSLYLIPIMYFFLKKLYFKNPGKM